MKNLTEDITSLWLKILPLIAKSYYQNAVNAETQSQVDRKFKECLSDRDKEMFAKWKQTNNDLVLID